MEYIINDNYTEIIAGTSNKMHPAYMEAANNIEKNTSTGVQYLKNFLQSIENISDKEAVKDERISKSKGNVKNFEGYDNIKSALEFINKNLKNAETAKECKEMHDLLVKYQPQYTEAYDKKNKIVVLEYESAVYMLVTSLSLILANNMDVVSNGTEIRIQPKSATTFGVIPDTMKKLVREMKDAKHEDYLKELNKGFDNKEPGKVTTEGVYVEDVLGGINVGMMAIGLAKDVIGTVGSIAKGSITLARNIRKSLFGIIPMIRSVAYFRYKKKADTIISLEQQIEFIKANIEQLENRTNIDPKKKEQIIKKQKAAIEKYQKKSAKLRAQLMETEKEAAKEIEKENPQISDADDDFVLESGKSINEIFGENDSFTEAGRRSRKNKSSLRGNSIAIHRDEIVSKLGISETAPEKKGTPTKEEEPENMKKIHDEIEKYRKEHTRKSIRLIPGAELKSDDDKSKLLDTKIGGTPYWPKDTEFPKFGNDPMIMVAQLNFDKLPKLEGFPTTGILQFFLDTDETWDDNSRIKVVYHEKPDADNALEEIPVTTFTCGDRISFIDGSCYYPTAKEEDDYINHGNETPDPFKEIEAKFSEAEKKNVNEAIWTDMKSSWGTRLGGWPSYTQSEPGYVKEDTVQLLQLDSEDGMMWGDCGIAHFFINKDDLAKKNFSKVMFTWDCC